MKKCKTCSIELSNRNVSGYCIKHIVHRKTHGMTGTIEYKTWGGIKRRCFNKKDISYERYGNLGISMCDKWKNSFEEFYKDMGKRPSKKHSIDRIDNSKGYSKENCRWATTLEQARNKGNVELYKGKCFREYDEELGLRSGTVRMRVRKYGWDIEKATTTRKKKTRGYIYDEARNKYRAYANHIFLGRFDTESEAIEARKKYLKEYKKPLSEQKPEVREFLENIIL